MNKKALKDIAVFIRNGVTVSQVKEISGLPITRIETIADRTINLEKCGYAGLTEQDYPDHLLSKGDILISHINSEKHLAKCAIFEVDKKVVHGMNLLCLRTNKEIALPKYIFYAISSPYFLSLIPKITKKSVNQASFSISHFRELEIPVPSLDEQHHIAQALDQATSLIEKRKAQIAELDKLVKAVFLEMFGDPHTNIKNLPILYWKDIFNTTTGRLDANAMVDNGKYPFFTCAKEIYYIDDYAFDCEALLLAGNNASANYDVKHYSGKFNAYQRTYVLTLKNAGYSYEFFKVSLENQLGVLKNKSIGTNTRYLTMSILNELKFIAPSIDLQTLFAQKVCKIEAEKDRLQRSLAEMENNLTALMGRFLG